MSGYICISALRNCYAVMWSYGEICVHCNCCGRYEKGLWMWLARLRYHDCQLQVDENFDDYSEHWEALQRRNVKLNIAYDKRMIKKCEERIEHFVRKELSL